MGRVATAPRHEMQDQDPDDLFQRSLLDIIAKDEHLVVFLITVDTDIKMHIGSSNEAC